MNRRMAMLALGVAGLALLVAASARVIITSNSGGIITLMIVGAVLLISPFVITRMETLSLNARGLELTLTREMAELGAPRTARILDRTDLARYAESYAFVQPELTGPRYEEARVHLEAALGQRAAALARQEKFEPSEVRALFGQSSPAMRALAVGLMKGDPSLADGASILAAIADPASRNEQYQGLELAKSCWGQLSASYRAAIRSVVTTSEGLVPEGEPGRLAAELLRLPDA